MWRWDCLPGIIDIPFVAPAIDVGADFQLIAFARQLQAKNATIWGFHATLGV